MFKYFWTLKSKLISSPVIVAPDWELPFTLMCDASDFAIGVVLGQRKGKNFLVIYYANKVLPSRAIEVHHPSKRIFTMNGQWLKHYLGGNFNTERVSVVLSIPK